MSSRTERGSEGLSGERPDRWFAIVSTAGAFALIAASVASWLPVSDALLAHLQIPISTCSGVIGAALAYIGKHRIG